MGNYIQLFCIGVWGWLLLFGNCFFVYHCLSCEFYKLLHFICPVIAAHFFDIFGTISYGGHNLVGMGDGGFFDYLVDKLSGVGEPLTVACFDVA